MAPAGPGPGAGTGRRLAQAVTLFTGFILFDWVRNDILGTHTRQEGSTEGLVRIWAVNAILAILVALVLVAVFRPVFRRPALRRWEGPLFGAVLFLLLCLVESVHHYDRPVTGLLAGLAGGAVLVLAGGLARVRFRWVFFALSQALLVLLPVATRLTGGGPSPLTPVPPPDRPLPNIFLFVVDTVRSDHLSLYGYPKPTTPFLDALGRRSAVFADAYSGTPTTTPSTAAILGAPFPFTSDFPENRMMPGEVTLASYLRSAGYRTGAVSANPFISAEMGFDRGFLRFDHLRFPEKDYAVTHVLWAAGEALGLPLPDMLRADRVRKRAVRWLRAQDGDRPVFVYLHFMDPHYPYTPHPRFRAAFLEPGQKPLQRFPGGVAAGQLPGDPGTPIPAEARAGMTALYDAEIAQWDHHLGLLWEDLTDGGWLETALVIVTSDHGESFFEHGVWLHGNSLFNEVLRVPLLVYRSWAGDGRRIDAPVSNTMIADGIRRIVDGFPGSRAEDPAALLAAGTAPLVCQYSYGRGDCRGAAVVRGSMKSLVLRKRDAETRLLFDLERDPGETANLYPDTSWAWAEAASALVPSTEDAARPTVSRSTEDLLRSLGYIH
jgi:arylsulfatase A-like enzyme